MPRMSAPARPPAVRGHRAGCVRRPRTGGGDSAGRRHSPARCYRRIELARHLLGILPAVGRPLLEAFHDQRGEQGRAGGAPIGQRLRGLGDVRREDLLGRHPGEGRASGQHLVGHDAEGVDVRPLVDVLLRRRLLRRHVGRRAERHAHGGHVLATGRLAERLGHAEVHHQRVAARQHHVVGLDIAVHDPARVGVRQRVGHLTQDANRVGNRQLAL